MGTVDGDDHLGRQDEEEEQAESVEQRGARLLHIVDLRLRRRHGAHQQEALRAVEEDAEGVVATPLRAEQRGKQHAPALRDDEEATREAALRRAHEDEESVVEKLHAHHHHALEDGSHAPVGGDVVVDCRVNNVRELCVREGSGECKMHAEEDCDEGMQGCALCVVVDKEYHPP